MMLRVVGSMVLAGVLVFAPLAASAQVTPPPGTQRQRLELERRLRMGFQRSIQNQLNFSAEKMAGVQAVMESFQTDRQGLNRAQASLRYRLRDPALQDIGDDEARALLEEMVAAQEQELELYKREQEELLKLMSASELVRFYRLRDDLGQRMQRLRQGRGQGGGRGGVGGGVGIGAQDVRGGAAGEWFFR